MTQETSTQALQKLYATRDNILAHREAANVLRNKSYTGPKTVIAVRELCKAGIVGARLEALLDIVSRPEGGKGEGAIIENFAEAVIEDMGEELQTISNTNHTFQSFLDRVHDVIGLRYNIRESGYNVTFKQAFKLYKGMGNETIEYLERLDDIMSRKRSDRIPTHTLAKILCEIVDESEKRGHTIEVVFSQYLQESALVKDPFKEFSEE